MKIWKIIRFVHEIQNNWLSRIADERRMRNLDKWNSHYQRQAVQFDLIIETLRRRKRTMQPAPPDILIQT